MEQNSHVQYLVLQLCILSIPTHPWAPSLECNELVTVCCTLKSFRSCVRSIPHWVAPMHGAIRKGPRIGWHNAAPLGCADIIELLRLLHPQACLKQDPTVDGKR